MLIPPESASGRVYRLRPFEGPHASGPLSDPASPTNTVLALARGPECRTCTGGSSRTGVERPPGRGSGDLPSLRRGSHARTPSIGVLAVGRRTPPRPRAPPPSQGDVRGTRGRAEAIRDAIAAAYRAGADVEAAIAAAIAAWCNRRAGAVLAQKAHWDQKTGRSGTTCRSCPLTLLLSDLVVQINGNSGKPVIGPPSGGRPDGPRRLSSRSHKEGRRRVHGWQATTKP
jgi:hypothetical protein